ncbi:MAG: hypothetical protein K1X88_06040 [Nannocystaceae bacterium]|nr:hypothetical protein [Nannocystaceae bacterium]
MRSYRSLALLAFPLVLGALGLGAVLLRGRLAPHAELDLGIAIACALLATTLGWFAVLRTGGQPSAAMD